MLNFDDLRMQRQVAHLHGLGKRPLGEFLTELAARIGGGPAIAGLLEEYARLTPGMVRAAGGDRYPPRVLHAVPTERMAHG